MPELIRFLDTVAVTEDLPGKHLCRGQVGTVKDMIAPGVFEVEFSDEKGRMYASVELRAEHLMVLHYGPR
ncbi:MAG: DUF4926 domain-containing protein [Betaproteobacteria bacterium]|nr:DUF4926 domain-containing protein [Betaproteobacteria bacterium]